eukprot:gene2778-4186_t
MRKNLFNRYNLNLVEEEYKEKRFLDDDPKLLMKLFSYMEPKNLTTVKQVCKSWNKKCVTLEKYIIWYVSKIDTTKKNYHFSIHNAPEEFFRMPLLSNDLKLKNTITTTTFVNPEHKFKFFRCLIDTTKNTKNLSDLKQMKKTVLVLLIHGGDFAGCIFQNGKPVLHKTFSKYVTRKKQGKKQSTKDKESRASSAGSNIRRRNEEKFNEKVNEILNEWEKYIVQSSLVFIHMPGGNKDLLKDTPLEEAKNLKSIPFQTGTPNYTQTIDAFEKLSMCEILL